MPNYRLRSASRIRQVRGTRPVYEGKITSIYFLTGPQCRLAIMIPKKVQRLAVMRNRTKRVLRHAFRSVLNGLPPGDYVAQIRPRFSQLPAANQFKVLQQVCLSLKRSS